MSSWRNEKKSRKIRICILYARWMVEMEDVTLVNNMTLYECDQVRCDSVEAYHAQRSTRCLAVTRNTTQWLHNVKCCALEHLRWFTFLGKSCTLEISLPAVTRVQNKRWSRMLPQLQQLSYTDNKNDISVITILPHSLSPRSHPLLSLGAARVFWLVTQAQRLLFV